jgi:Domain of unknown function (DUF6468)
MDLLMNGLLMAATLFAGGYCWVLGRRVRDLKSLDKGLGGAIVTLTRQVELARVTLDEARASAKDTRQDLGQLIARADASAGQLRLLIAAAPTRPEPATGVQPVAEAAPPAAAQPEPVAAAAPVALRAVADPEPLPQPASRPAPHLAEVPKPRALVPVENPLRRAKPVAGAEAATDGASEAEILEALTALAGGR